MEIILKNCIWLDWLSCTQTLKGFQIPNSKSKTWHAFCIFLFNCRLMLRLIFAMLALIVVPQFHIKLIIQFWTNHNAATCPIIATLDNCVKQPGMLRCAAATKMLAMWSYICGISVRNICHHHFSFAHEYSSQRRSTQPFGVNAVKSVSLHKCYLDI